MEGGMTTAELLAVLARECPNGVSFDPMAVRLLRQKIPLEDWQIEDLKGAMFQLMSGLWFSREMILDDESHLGFEKQAMEWLMEHGCFSVERLFEDFCSVLSQISTPEARAEFLQHLGFTVTAWGKGGLFCSLPPPNLDDSLVAISEAIAGWLEEVDGTLTFNEIEQAMPYLTAEALEGIRVQFLPEVHAMEVGGVPCWCSTEVIHLPEDFSEILTNAVDTLVSLGERVSVANLEFALNMHYRIRFREEYTLTDKDTFLHVCVKHYQGGNNVFPNTKKPRINSNDWSVPSKRVRSPNTRFRNLGVPIGAKLVFTKDNHITCTVLDDSNHVEYNGKAWVISAMAIHLLGVSSANGFCHFSYEGEILWDRRLRLERVDKQDECQLAETSPLTEVQETESRVIGLEGQSISSPTWREFRSAGINPRPITLFRDLGVPIGAKLALTKDSHITCTVIDDSNRVEYDGKLWTISALAKIFNKSAVSGFAYFSYQGETLLERQLQLKQAGKQVKYQPEEILPSYQAKEAKAGIVGLDGRILSPADWREFRSAGINPFVAEWSRRVMNGESEENIALENGVMVSTVKEYIINRRQYFDICEKNDIVPEPEGGANV
jgi:hypothetical protein